MNWQPIATTRPVHMDHVLACNADNPRWGIRVVHYNAKSNEWSNDSSVVFHGLTHWHELPAFPEPQA